VPPKEFRLIHLDGIFHVHVHELKNHEVWLPNMLHPPEKKEKDEQNSYLVSQKKRRSKKGEVCKAMHKTTMDYIFI